MSTLQAVTDWWDARPCNVQHSNLDVGSIEYFDEVERKKYTVEPHILEFAEFERWNGRRVLEVGCGIGTDAVNFARHGADYTGIELSDVSLRLAKRRFEVFDLPGDLHNRNAEEPFELGEFDLIYSFGVIHHSPNPERIVRNIHDALRPGGTFKLMLYAEHSWKKAMIDSGFDQYEAQSNCPIANTYTILEVHELLRDFQDISVKQTHIFPYSIPEYKRHEYKREPWFEAMSEEMFHALESKLGWHLCITCSRAT